MSLEALKREILGSANKRREEIIKEAREEAESIINEAKAKAEKIVSSKRESVIKELNEKKRAATAVARLEGRRKVSMAKAEVVSKAFEEARRWLTELKKTKRYIDVISNYIREALENLGVDEANIRVSKEDYDFIKSSFKDIESRVASNLGKKIKLKLLDDHVDILGGVVVSDVDDIQYYINTFDSRINRVYEEDLDRIMEILFGG